MTTALSVRGPQRHPSQASGRLRKAAEHYVRNGCKAIGPSMVYAGYSQNTAKDPSANGYTHDRLVEVARYWHKGSQETARSHLSTAINTLARMLNEPDAPAAARGAAAKVLIDVAGKEREGEDTAETTAEEQAKWLGLVRHWKRVFLRRGILLGIEMGKVPDEVWPPDGGEQGWRGYRLLKELNWMLGKGPRPDWWVPAEDEDDDVVDAEVAE